MQRTMTSALELDKVLALLAAEAATADAADAARALQPSPYLAEVERRLQETDDASRLAAGFGRQASAGDAQLVRRHAWRVPLMHRMPPDAELRLAESAHYRLA